MLRSPGKSLWWQHRKGLTDYKRLPQPLGLKGSLKAYVGRKKLNAYRVLDPGGATVIVNCGITVVDAASAKS